MTPPDSEAPGPDPLDTSLLFEVFALNQAAGRFLAEAMGDGPLTPAEYAVATPTFGAPTTAGKAHGTP